MASGTHNSGEGRTLPGVSWNRKRAKEGGIWLNIWSPKNPYSREYTPCTTRGQFWVLSNLGDQFIVYISTDQTTFKDHICHDNETLCFCSHRTFIHEKLPGSDRDFHLLCSPDSHFLGCQHSSQRQALEKREMENHRRDVMLQLVPTAGMGRAGQGWWVGYWQECGCTQGPV